MRSAIDPKDLSSENSTACSDEELLRQYRSTSDQGVFSELVHRYERELFNYLRRYLGDAAMAEDTFQATFLQVHLKCGQFEDERRFRPWLYTIATHQAIDAQRRNKRHQAASLDRRGKNEEADDVGSLIEMLSTNEPGPGSALEDAERRDWIRREVEKLPDTLRAALLLVYYQGLKYREAADALEIPVGTVKSRLHAALLKLNEAWTTEHTFDADGQ